MAAGGVGGCRLLHLEIGVDGDGGAPSDGAPDRPPVCSRRLLPRITEVMDAPASACVRGRAAWPRGGQVPWRAVVVVAVANDGDGAARRARVPAAPAADGRAAAANPCWPTGGIRRGRAYARVAQAASGVCTQGDAPQFVVRRRLLFLPHTSARVCCTHRTPTAATLDA